MQPRQISLSTLSPTVLFMFSLCCSEGIQKWINDEMSVQLSRYDCFLLTLCGRSWTFNHLTIPFVHLFRLFYYTYMSSCQSFNHLLLILLPHFNYWPYFHLLFQPFSLLNCLYIYFNQINCLICKNLTFNYTISVFINGLSNIQVQYFQLSVS